MLKVVVFKETESIDATSNGGTCLEAAKAAERWRMRTRMRHWSIVWSWFLQKVEIRSKFFWLDLFLSWPLGEAVAVGAIESGLARTVWGWEKWWDFRRVSPRINSLMAWSTMGKREQLSNWLRIESKSSRMPIKDWWRHRRSWCALTSLASETVLMTGLEVASWS